MESWNIENILISIVESMLPTFHDRKIGLVMALSFDWHAMKSDGTSLGRFSRNHLLLFQRPTNYTKVFHKDISDTDIPMFLFMRDLKANPMKMKMLSDHDSCWRSDGFRWVFRTFSDAWDYFDEIDVDGRKENPTIRMIQHSGQPHYRFIQIEPDDPNNRHHCDWSVDIQGVVPLSDISQYMPKQRR